MFGKNPRMNSLASRKQLLLAESELNRILLVQEWQTMADGVRCVADRARTISSLALTTVSWVMGLASFRRNKSAPAGEKVSWWQTLLKGAQLAGSLWLEFSPQPKP
jgi:hypothetical protein